MRIVQVTEDVTLAPERLVGAWAALVGLQGLT
jgi:hypothetical protein